MGRRDRRGGETDQMTDEPSIISPGLYPAKGKEGTSIIESLSIIRGKKLF